MYTKAVSKHLLDGVCEREFTAAIRTDREFSIPQLPTQYAANNTEFKYRWYEAKNNLQQRNSRTCEKIDCWDDPMETNLLLGQSTSGGLGLPNENECYCGTQTYSQ